MAFKHEDASRYQALLDMVMSPNLRAIILYGSRCKDCFDEFSDTDILVIVNGSPRGKKTLNIEGMRFDLVYMSPERLRLELSQSYSDNNNFALNALHRSIVIWQHGTFGDEIQDEALKRFVMGPEPLTVDEQLLGLHYRCTAPVAQTPVFCRYGLLLAWSSASCPDKSPCTNALVSPALIAAISSS